MYEDTVSIDVPSADPVSPYAQSIKAKGVSDDPRRERLWVSQRITNRLNLRSSCIALLLQFVFLKAKPGGLSNTLCDRPLQASQGADAIQSMLVFSYYLLSG